MVTKTVLRDSLGFATTQFNNLYDSVENSNGLVRFGLQTISVSTGWFTKPLLKKVVEMSDPIVVTLDSKLAVAVDVVNEKIIKPAQAKEHGHVSIVGIAKQVTEQLTLELSNRYEALLEFTDDSVDTWLPAVSEDEKQGRKFFSLDDVLHKSDKGKASVSSIYKKASLRAVRKANSMLKDSFVVVKVVADTVVEKVERNFPVKENLSALRAKIDELRLKVSSGFWNTYSKCRSVASSKVSAVCGDVNGVLKFVSKKYEDAGITSKVDEVKVAASKLSFPRLSEYALVRLHLRDSKEDVSATEMEIIELAHALAGVVGVMHSPKELAFSA